MRLSVKPSQPEIASRTSGSTLEARRGNGPSKVRSIGGGARMASAVDGSTDAVAVSGASASAAGASVGSAAAGAEGCAGHTGRIGRDAMSTEGSSVKFAGGNASKVLTKMSASLIKYAEQSPCGSSVPAACSFTRSFSSRRRICLGLSLSLLAATVAMDCQSASHNTQVSGDLAVASFVSPRRTLGII